MEIITVDQENLDKEHICCAISVKKGDNSVALKKQWLKERMEEGLVFKKLDARGKVFIEYLPANKAWCPINGDNYMFIDCLWVSGQYAGHGYARKLVDACIEDAKKQNMAGIVIVSSDKKRPYLSDPKFLKHYGFEVVDKANPHFELYCLSFDKLAALPSFIETVKDGKIAQKGMVIYYTNQCVFSEKQTLLLKELAQDKLTIIKVEDAKSIHDGLPIYSAFSFFDHGEFVTNEILSEKKFMKYLENRSDCND